MKNKELWLVAGVAFVAGLLVGLLVADVRRSSTVEARPPRSNTAVMPGSNQIELLNRMVAEQPDNLNAWVRLAHENFDADRPMEAVKAYARALALRPDDADLLTDQGVMFRRLGWFDQAVANFSRAAEVDATHIQSLYNLGIVYRYDLNDTPRAIEAWSRYLQREPAGQSAQRVRTEIDQMRSGIDTRLPQ